MTQTHEYKVIPAPRRGEKARGAKSVGERFGVALAHAMNEMAREGWEYLRAETLPCDERSGLTGTATHFHHMLVFRRPLALAEAAPAKPRGFFSRAPAAEKPAGPPPPVAASAPAATAATAARAETPSEATLIAPLRTVAPGGSAPLLGPAPIELPPPVRR